jgi:hypothetical protein
MVRVKRGANQVDLGRKSAQRKARRSGITVDNVEDVGSTTNHKWSHNVIQ